MVVVYELEQGEVRRVVRDGVALVLPCYDYGRNGGLEYREWTRLDAPRTILEVREIHAIRRPAPAGGPA